MGKIKVCLVFPRLKYISGDPPMGVGYLASYLKENPDTDVSIIDTTFRRSLNMVFTELKKDRPDILGIYADAIMMRDALSIADWAQQENIYTIFGGPQPTVSPESFMLHADVVVQGEGELILRDIVKNSHHSDLSGVPGIWWKREEKIIQNKPNGNFIELEESLFPQRELLPMEQYIYNWNYLDVLNTKRRGTTMMVSRGCPFSCTYCQPTLRNMFGKKVRFRSTRNVAEEIKLLKEGYNIDSIFFHDDTLTVDHVWLEEFCRIILDEKLNILWGCNSRVDTINERILKMMFEAGLRVIHFGIESGSQRVLDVIYSKKIRLEEVKESVSLARKIGIHTMGFFMLGAPFETIGEINKTISFARNLKLKEATFSLTTPLKGTYLNNMLLSDTRLGVDYQKFDYYSKYAIKGGISPRHIKFLQIKALLFFYLHPYRFKYIVKHSASIRGMRKLLNKVRRFF